MFLCTHTSLGFDLTEISENAADDIEGLDAAAAHVANMLSTEPENSMNLSQHFPFTELINSDTQLNLFLFSFKIKRLSYLLSFKLPWFSTVMSLLFSFILF